MKGERGGSLGIANLLSDILVEDFTWFFYRWWSPLDNDPKKGLLIQASDWTTKNLGGLHILHVDLVGGFVIPYWYIIVIIITGIFYYLAFKKSTKRL